MPWPTFIELSDRSVSHSTGGGVVQNVWYIEPADAAPAVVSVLQGWVGPGATYENRVLPIHDFEYKYYYCCETKVVPFDQRQHSYYSSTMYNTPGQQINEEAVRQGLTAFNKCKPTDTRYEIGKNVAGVYVVATYMPIFSAYTGTDEKLAWDYTNYRVEIQERVNKINLALKIRTFNRPANNKIVDWFFTDYPDSGLKPEMLEMFSEIYVERKMLPVTFNFDILNGMTNAVNNITDIKGGPKAGTNTIIPKQKIGSCRYVGYKVEVCTSPRVNADGDPDGVNRWLNVTNKFQCRTHKTARSMNRDGVLVGVPETLDWNQILVHPGKSAQVGAAIFGVDNALGWYYVGYSSKFSTFETDAQTAPENYQFPYRDIRDVFEKQ